MASRRFYLVLDIEERCLPRDVSEYAEDIAAELRAEYCGPDAAWHFKDVIVFEDYLDLANHEHTGNE